MSRYSCRRATLCRIFRLTSSQCRTRIALHPLKSLKKRPCRTRLGGCRTSTLHCIDPKLCFVSRLSRNYPHRGAVLKEERKPSLVGERQFGRNFKTQFGGQLRVKIAEIVLRQWGGNLCQESPRETKPKKGPKRKAHEFRPFL